MAPVQLSLNIFPRSMKPNTVHVSLDKINSIYDKWNGRFKVGETFQKMKLSFQCTILRKLNLFSTQGELIKL